MFINRFLRPLSTNQICIATMPKLSSSKASKYKLSIISRAKFGSLKITIIRSLVKGIARTTLRTKDRENLGAEELRIA